MDNLLPTFGSKVQHLLAALPTIDEEVQKLHDTEDQQQEIEELEATIRKAMVDGLGDENDSNVLYPKEVNARCRDTPYDKTNPSPLSLKSGMNQPTNSITSNRAHTKYKQGPKNIFSVPSNWQHLLVYNLQPYSSVDVFARASLSDSGVSLRTKEDNMRTMKSSLSLKLDHVSTIAATTRKNMKGITALLPDAGVVNPGMAHLNVPSLAISVFPSRNRPAARPSRTSNRHGSFVKFSSSILSSENGTFCGTSKVSASSSKTTATPQTPSPGAPSVHSEAEPSFLVNHADELSRFPGVAWAAFELGFHSLHCGANINDTLSSFGSHFPAGPSDQSSPVQLRVNNSSSRSQVQVYRINPDASFELIHRVEAGGAWEVESSSAQPWCLVDSVSGRGGIFKVGDTLAKHRTSAKCLMWTPQVSLNGNQGEGTGLNSSISFVSIRRGSMKSKRNSKPSLYNQLTGRGANNQLFLLQITVLS